MAVFLAANVQRCPFTIPVKWYRLFSFVEVVKCLEVIIFDDASTFLVKKAESDLILGIWFGQEVFKSSPIMDAYASSLSAICNMKKDGILLSADFVLQFRRAVSSISLDEVDTGLGETDWGDSGIGETHIVLVGWSNCIDKLFFRHV